MKKKFFAIEYFFKVENFHLTQQSCSFNQRNISLVAILNSNEPGFLVLTKSTKKKMISSRRETRIR